MIATPEALRATASIYLLSPQVPMLFMGEEWAATSPFLFFCDFSGDLAEAVRKGRREEFARFPEFQDPEMRQRIPDPEAQSTFMASKLKWDEIVDDPHRGQLAWTTRILSVRRETVAPLVPSFGGHAGSFSVIGTSAVTVIWTARTGTRLRLDVNLKGTAQNGFERPAGDMVWTEGHAEGDHLQPWSVRWTLERPTPSN